MAHPSMMAAALEGLTAEALVEAIAQLPPLPPPRRRAHFREILLDQARASFSNVVRGSRESRPPLLERVTWRYHQEAEQFIFSANFLGPRCDYNWVVDCERLGESARVINLALTSGFDRECERLYRDIVAEEHFRHQRARGLTLLMEWLSPAQLAQYKTYCHFDVTGGSSGKRYRIKHGQVQNVWELDAGGQEICGWCFAPAGGLVPGDVMLAQKVALETNEAGALAVANPFGGGPAALAAMRARNEA